MIPRSAKPTTVDDPVPAVTGLASRSFATRAIALASIGREVLGPSHDPSFFKP